MICIYRMSDGFYVDDTKINEYGHEDDTEIWLEKVRFKPLEIWWLRSYNRSPEIHPWKIEIEYLEEYKPLADFGYESLDQVPQFIASV